MRPTETYEYLVFRLPEVAVGDSESAWYLAWSGMAESERDALFVAGRIGALPEGRFEYKVIEATDVVSHFVSIKTEREVSVDQAIGAAA